MATALGGGARSRASQRGDGAQSYSAGPDEATDGSEIENALHRLEDMRRELIHRDEENIRRSVSYVDDVQSAMWTMPHFGAFAAMRLVMAIVCGEIMMAVAIMFTDGGFDTPGWIALTGPLPDVDSWPPMQPAPTCTGKHTRNSELTGHSRCR